MDRHLADFMNCFMVVDILMSSGEGSLYFAVVSMSVNDVILSRNAVLFVVRLGDCWYSSLCIINLDHVR